MSSEIPVTGHQILCTLDKVLLDRGMTLTELSERVGVTLANLSILKNNRAKAIRFSTLTAICLALDCDVAELIRFDIPHANETNTGS